MAPITAKQTKECTVFKHHNSFGLPSQRTALSCDVATNPSQIQKPTLAPSAGEADPNKPMM